MRLLAISDVTCDYMGSIDFMRHFTTIEKPYFVYEPENDKIIHDVDNCKSGILYNSIENMPTQFPVDASAHFGSKLLPFIVDILKSDPSKALSEQGLPKPIENAVITSNGKLTNLYTYISKLRQQNVVIDNNDKVLDVRLVRKNSELNKGLGRIKIYKLCGHLFDKNTINKVMDYIVGK